MNLNELLNLLPEGEHVYLTGHVHPDGDCVGATLGLYNVLNKYRDTTVVLEERPESYSDLSGFCAIVDYSKYQSLKSDIFGTDYSLIVMDSGDLSRIEPIKDLFENATTTVNIDHHDSNSNFAMYNYVDTKASSTCEMVGAIVGLLEGDETYLNVDLAQCLYTGIIYDTGVFKHSNTRKQTHQIASYLVSTGIDFTGMINKMYFTRSHNSVTALKLAVNNLELVNDDQIVMTLISYKELQEHELSKRDTESVVSFLNEIEGPYASAFFLELKPREYKASFRSAGFMNVCNVAKQFGGGGHIKASGCTVTGEKDQVVAKVLKELKSEYQRNN